MVLYVVHCNLHCLTFSALLFGHSHSQYGHDSRHSLFDHGSHHGHHSRHSPQDHGSHHGHRGHGHHSHRGHGHRSHRSLHRGHHGLRSSPRARSHWPWRP